MSKGGTFMYLYEKEKVVVSDARGAAGETSACDSNDAVGADTRCHIEHHSFDKQSTNGCAALIVYATRAVAWRGTL